MSPSTEVMVSLGWMTIEQGKALLYAIFPNYPDPLLNNLVRSTDKKVTA